MAGRRRDRAPHIQSCCRHAGHTLAGPQRHQKCTHHKSNPSATQASKTELATGLALKSNVSDVGKAVDELSQALEERPTFTEMSSTLREFATKIDLSNLMAITETARNMGRSL